jgi:hypothetical protein
VQYINGFRCLEAGRMLNSNDFKSIFSKDKATLKYFRNAQTLGGFANAFNYLGGFCIGYPLGSMIKAGQIYRNCIYT